MVIGSGLISLYAGSSMEMVDKVVVCNILEKKVLETVVLTFTSAAFVFHYKFHLKNLFIMF